MSKLILLLFCFFICAISREITLADDCQNPGTHGADYTGTVDQTYSGIPCQTWSSQKPHEHKFGNVGNHNYCRNPDEGDSVWCYTMVWFGLVFCCRYYSDLGNTLAPTTTEESTATSQTPGTGTTTATTITEEPTTTSQTPVNRARSSSVREMATELFGPQFAIDGDISPIELLFFHSALEDYPWIEIKLSSPTEISAVQIINRRDCCGQRLHKAEVRAGDVSVQHGTKGEPLDVNSVCGKYDGPGETGVDPVIKCTSSILANYVTVQLMAHQSYLQINELLFQ